MSPPAPPPKNRGEFDLIAWARERSAARGPTVVGIGDDCAVLKLNADRQTLVTTDMLMEGRHFHLEETSARQIGYKALAVNLSDIAAMAGIPIAAVAAVALPRSRAQTLFEELFAGMMDLAVANNVDLVGGDTNAWDGPLVLSLTVLGEANRPVLRSGAQVGDSVFVTGPLGGSLLGRHLRPTPRIAEAQALASAVTLHAMIDVSDGLSSDLRHILEESGRLGAILESESIPIHDDARRQSHLTGRTPLDHALNDGEDFELCFTVSADDAEKLIRHPPDRVSLYKIGEIISEPGMILRDRAGSRTQLRPGGFDHLSA
jgi:thiamine-monophosphate kinase